MLEFGDGERRLVEGDAPVEFDGAKAPACRLIDGPTRDLNLMGRPSAGRISMQRAAVGLEMPCAARWRGVYTASPALLQAQAGAALDLPAHSLAWSDEPGVPWALGARDGLPLRAWWLLWEPAR